MLFKSLVFNDMLNYLAKDITKTKDKKLTSRVLLTELQFVCL